MSPKSSLASTYRERRQPKAQVISRLLSPVVIMNEKLESQVANPTLQIGSVTLIHPVRKLNTCRTLADQREYRHGGAPEVFDPNNAGNYREMVDVAVVQMPREYSYCVVALETKKRSSKNIEKTSVGGKKGKS